MIGQAFMLIAAVGCVAVAAVANPIVLASFLGLSGLPRSMVVMLWVVDALLVLVAGLLTYRRREPRVQMNAALLAGTLAFAAGMGEAALRIMDFRPGALTLFRKDPHDRGSFRLKPNLELNTALVGRPITIRTNSRGMRWRERPEKSPGAKQIAFVGDSFTFGLWADSEAQSFVGVADSALAPFGFESLNFGVPGYGLVEIELLVRDEIVALAPSHLVLAFYNGNDFLDTYLGTNRYRVSRSGVLDTDWEYIEGRIPAEFRGASRQTPLVERSYLYGLVRASAKRIWPRAVEATQRFVDTSKVDRSYTSNVFWSRVDYPPFAEAARDVSLETLRRIAALADSAGMRLVIVTIPSVEQVHLAAAFGAGYDINRPQSIIAEFARDRRIDYLDLFPVLADAAERGIEPYFRHEGHFRNEGHRIAGEEIARFLGSRSAGP